jgi:hypothetical protein
MRASQKSKRKKAKANQTLAPVCSTLSMATHNLVNMVAVTAVSGAVLLTLLAAKHFWNLLRAVPATDWQALSPHGEPSAGQLRKRRIAGFRQRQARGTLWGRLS